MLRSAVEWKSTIWGGGALSWTSVLSVSGQYHFEKGWVVLGWGVKLKATRLINVNRYWEKVEEFWNKNCWMAFSFLDPKNCCMIDKKWHFSFQDPVVQSLIRFNQTAIKINVLFLPATKYRWRGGMLESPCSSSVCSQRRFCSWCIWMSLLCVGAHWLYQVEIQVYSVVHYLIWLK